MTVTLPGTAGESKRYSATIHRILPDGSLENLRFTADAVTKADWFTVPREVTCRVVDGEPRRFQFGVLGSVESLATIKSVTTNIPDAVIHVKKNNLDPMIPTLVDVDIQGNVPAGTYSVIVETTDAKVPQRAVPVLICHDSKYDVVPRSLFLRKVEHGKGFVGRLSVLAGNGDNEVAWEEPEGLDCRIVTSSEVEGRSVVVIEVYATSVVEELVEQPLVIHLHLPSSQVKSWQIPVRIAP
jgi:hypothetical protein